jgi:hypothetical protein
LEALIIGGYVRALSDRDIESLMEEAGLGQVSKSTASRICPECPVATDSRPPPRLWAMPRLRHTRIIVLTTFAVDGGTSAAMAHRGGRLGSTRQRVGPVGATLRRLRFATSGTDRSSRRRGGPARVA